MIGVSFVIYLAAIINIVFRCVSQQAIWDPSYQGGHCVSVNAAIIITGAYNVFSDLIMLLLPICATLRLHMAMKPKAGIVVVFTTGSM